MNTPDQSSASPPDRRPFAFLDRDGTIITDRHHLADPAGVELCHEAAEGLAMLQRAGYRLVVISNQSGIGRGYFQESDVAAVNERLRETLRAKGIHLEAIYWCPHAPDEGCKCRKPLPGLIERALAELGGDLRGACVIGDNPSDLQLARDLGLVAVYVTTGRDPLASDMLDPQPDFRADTLKDAARFILSQTPPPSTTS